MRDKSTPTTARPIKTATAGEPAASPFPLPFTPFEYYYLLENRADYASAFPITLEARGPFDRCAFTAALRLALERHPFLSARIEPDRGGWPQWIDSEIPEICWGAEPNAQATCTSTASTGGLQLQIWQQGDRTEWRFLFHHVAVDGMGAFVFIADLFLAYAHFAIGEDGPPRLRKMEVERLRDRAGHHLFNGRVRLIDLLRIGTVTLPLQIIRAAVLSDHGHPPPAASSGPLDDLVHYLTADETAGLSRVAGSLNVMLNDLLMRDYFLMLADWNRDTAEEHRPIRVLLPMNLRRREDYRMPAANVFSFSFLSRRIGECGDRCKLLWSIRDEIALIKKQKRGLYFEAGLRLFCIWPAMLRWSLRRQWPFATAIFTNLGTGLDNVPLPEQDGRKICGDLVFEGGSGAGPIRPDTRLSFAVHTYAGRMALCVRCDPRYFAAAQQQEILDAYLEKLRTTIRTGT